MVSIYNIRSIMGHELILHQQVKINQTFGHISVLVRPFLSAQLSPLLNCFSYHSPKCPFYLNSGNELPDSEARPGTGETLKLHFFFLFLF